MVNLNRLFNYAVFLFVISAFLDEILMFSFHKRTFTFLLEMNPFGFLIKVILFSAIFGLYYFFNKNDFVMSTMISIISILSIGWIIFTIVKFVR
jgi:hypothetical protein